MLSRKFIISIKLNDLPAYKIAHQSGISPTTLSKLICGIERTRPNDSRIIKVSKILGLSPAECFEAEKGEQS